MVSELPELEELLSTYQLVILNTKKSKTPQKCASSVSPWLSKSHGHALRKYTSINQHVLRANACEMAGATIRQPGSHKHTGKQNSTPAVARPGHVCPFMYSVGLSSLLTKAEVQTGPSTALTCKPLSLCFHFLPYLCSFPLEKAKVDDIYTYIGFSGVQGAQIPNVDYAASF